jgi:predicted esterase YcpF (UPF0227 family)
MKVLYLHGYQGQPRQQMIDHLEGMGFEVIAPHLDYDNEPDVFIKLLKEDYDCIVGNSLGGYIGYYLSEWKGVPSILINPPMYMNLKLQVNQPTAELIYGSRKSRNIVTKKYIVVGMEDEVVNPFKVIEWLFENKPHSDLMVVDDMGHNYEYEQLFENIDCVLNKWLV